MKNIIKQILEIYFLGGNLNEILAAVDEYGRYKKINYAKYIGKQMFERWR